MCKREREITYSQYRHLHICRKIILKLGIFCKIRGFMRSLPYRCSAFTIRPQLLSLRASSTVYSTSSAAFAASSTAFSTAFTAFSTAFTVFSAAFTKFSTLPTLCSQLPILRSQTQEQDGCCGQTSFSCVSTRFSTTFQVFLGVQRTKEEDPFVLMRYRGKFLPLLQR